MCSSLKELAKNLYLVVIAFKLTGTELSIILNVKLKLCDGGFVLCYLCWLVSSVGDSW